MRTTTTAMKTAMATGLLLAGALTLSACDKGDTTDNKVKPGAASEDGTKADGEKTAAKGEGAPENAAAAKDPWAKKLEGRVLADSGLGIGGKLSPFDVLNCDGGDEYCQVCKFGPNPKIMAVGTLEDEAFRKDLKDLDAIVKKYGEDKVKVFAVLTELDGGKATTPADAAAAQAKAKAYRDELGLSFPVVVPAPQEGGTNKTWEEYYNITASRTVMFSDGRNEVKWSSVAPEDFADLGKAIDAVLEA